MERKLVNIVLGRFQPFTKGHEKIMTTMFKENGHPTVLLVISNKKFDAKHPFDDTVIQNEFDICYKGKDFYQDIIFVKSADIKAFSEALHDKGYEPVLWGCGTDRYPQFKKMADKYKEQFGLLPEFDAFEIKRTDDDISATKVREALKKDDKETYLKMMPDGAEKIYDELKAQLSKIQEGFMSLQDYIFFNETKLYDFD